MPVAGVRGLRGCPRPFARAPPALGGNTAADRRKKTRQRPQTRTRGTPVTPGLAMVMVSMPPAPGPPKRCGILGLIAIVPYHSRKVNTYDIAP